MTYDDTEKEFSYGGVSVTRYDYEALPCPMAATLLSDWKMSRIARDVHDYLVGKGWEQAEIDKYLSDVDGYDCDDVRTSDRIKRDFWVFMERAAVENGMQYWNEVSTGG